MIYLAKTVSP